MTTTRNYYFDFTNVTTINNNYTTNGGGGGMMEETKKFSLAVNLAAYCYIMPTIAVVGILGNVANLMTLANPRLKAVSYMYLRALGIADLLCMCFVLVFVFFEILKAHHYDNIAGDYSAAWYRAHLMLPLVNVSISAGILTVVALTVERYISICWPILFREWNSPRRAITLIVCAYVIPFLLYIPMCWQMEAVPKHFGTTGGSNETSDDGWNSKTLWKEFYIESLKHSTSYQAYKWTRETLLKFVPIVSLTVLNLQIILTFRKIRKRRQRLTTNQNGREQRSLLILLAGIAILFFTCNIPAAINLVFISEETKKLWGYVIFRATANLMEITNHALNFYVFCLCSADYRHSFLQTFPLVKNFTQRTTRLRRQVSESKLFKSSKSTTVTTTVSPTSGNNRSNHRKIIINNIATKQNPNGNCLSVNDTADLIIERKLRLSSNNLNENDAINEEECEPMTTAEREVSSDKVWIDDDNNAKCVYPTVLINGNSPVVKEEEAKEEDFVCGEETMLNGIINAVETKLNNDRYCNQQKQMNTIIVNQYCLCDEGADDVSL